LGKEHEREAAEEQKKKKTKKTTIKNLTTDYPETDPIMTLARLDFHRKAQRPEKKREETLLKYLLHRMALT
jgi:hypothetical protein